MLRWQRKCVWNITKRKNKNADAGAWLCNRKTERRRKAKSW